MNFDLGTHALQRALAPRTYVLRGIVKKFDGNYKVQMKVQAGDEYTLTCWARPLLPLSFSYEEGDEVLVEIRSLSCAYILGLAKELSGTDVAEEYLVRFGKTVLKGRKDGTSLEFTSGDGNLSIKHDITGTQIEATGLVTLTGDCIMLGDGMAPGLNAMTACPLSGMHAATNTKVLF